MKFLLTNLLFWFNAFAFALKSDAALPLLLQADNASFNRMAGTSIYEGHVTITQGTSLLTANKVVTHSDEKNNIQDLIAMGNPAHYQTQLNENKPLLVTTAQTITYHLKEGYIELLGNAQAQQGQDHIEGPMLIYKLIEQTLMAPYVHAGRTTITLHPKKGV